jgi:hypothetical protein
MIKQSRTSRRAMDTDDIMQSLAWHLFLYPFSHLMHSVQGSEQSRESV